VGGLNLERAQQRGGVVGHHGNRERTVGQRGAPRPAVVERDQAIAVREAVQLELPSIGGIAEPGDEQDVWPLAAAHYPKLDVAGVDPRCDQGLGLLLAQTTASADGHVDAEQGGDGPLALAGGDQGAGMIELGTVATEPIRTSRRLI
jgi:hypothetical protein